MRSLCVDVLRPVLAKQHDGKDENRKKGSGVVFIYSFFRSEGFFLVGENILIIQPTAGLSTSHPVAGKWVKEKLLLDLKDTNWRHPYGLVVWDLCHMVSVSLV